MREKDGSVARAALGQLAFHAGRPGFDRVKIAGLAYDVLADSGYAPTNRMVAMQVCGELYNEKALPIARAELQDNGSVLFKMVSIGAIGAMGTSADLPLLEPYRKSSDTRLSKAAAAAIGKITGVRTTNGVKSLKKSAKQ